jgi:hypothetical protein
MKKNLSATLLFGSLALAAFVNVQSAFAQKDTLKRWGNANWSGEKVLRIKEGGKAKWDTIQKSEYNVISSKYGLKKLANYDTTYQQFLLLKQRPPYYRGWKIANTIGPSFPFCGDWGSIFNTERDKTMFMRTGIRNNFALDYFWGKLGFGGLFGYQRFGIRKNAYESEVTTLAQRVYGLSANNITFFPSKPMENLFFVVGPVLSLPLGKKMNFDIGVKGGIFRNDPGQLLAITNVATNPPNRLFPGAALFQVFPTERRLYAGGNLGLALLYNLTDHWSLGLASDINYTTVDYYTLDYSAGTPGGNGISGAAVYKKFSRELGAFNLGLAAAYRFGEKKVIAIDPLLPPSCCEPVITDGINGKTYKNGETIPPLVFKWRSGCPDPTADETFTFRLYKKVGDVSKLISSLDNTHDTSVNWPSSEPSPASQPGFYYYTVHSTKNGKGGKCMSAVATSSFEVKPPAEIKEITKEVVKLAIPCVYESQIEGLTPFKRKQIKYGKTDSSCEGCICPVDTVEKSGNRWMVYQKDRVTEACDAGAPAMITSWPADVKIPTKVKKFRYTVKRTSYESTGGNSYVAATPEVTRYDMIVDRKTGAVQLVPIVEKKRRK